jgi:hypothetical protein
MGLTVAIMQPYFFPYGGYFRLFAAADLFVALDCVQFPRRGYVHRNQLKDFQARKQWLTLPLKKGNRVTTRICDLHFHDNARTLMNEQLRRFPALADIRVSDPALADLLMAFDLSPTEYLIQSLQAVTSRLGIFRPILRSSALGIPPEIHAQARIIKIAELVGATRYMHQEAANSMIEANSNIMAWN